MNTKNIKEVSTRPSNPILVACMKRYGQTGTVMKDRRIGRGGSKNKAREYLSGNY
jgi:hypothetical protein